jgi:hypothetical protein
MCLSQKEQIFLLIVITIIIIIYTNMPKNNKSEQFKCPDNCKRESKNDSLENMCFESCEDIYNNCPTTCNIVCECDATGTCLPKCRKNCEKDLKICRQKCDNMTPKVI